MLGLSSHMASESAAALCYRIALERHYRPELGGTGRCLEELANVMDTGENTPKSASYETYNVN